MRTGYVWVNGQLIGRDQAVVDIEDRGYQFGDGVYEVIPVYAGTPFKLDMHLARLVRSMEALGIKLGQPISRLSLQLEQLIEANDVDEGTIYVQVTRGVAARAHPFPKGDVQPAIVAYTKPHRRLEAQQREGVSAVLVEDIRWLRCDIKSLNLLGTVLAKQQAVEASAYEAILVRDRIVTEGSSTNVFRIQEGMLYTHPANTFILEGITRAVVMQLCSQLQLTVREESFTPEQLQAADELFLTSTTAEVMPVTRVNGQAIGSGEPGPITRRIQQAFFKLLGS